MTGPSLAVLDIGAEREPVAIIDGFAPDPHYLRDYAAGAAFAAGDLYYPGLKAALPADYFSAVQPVIAAAMAEVFGATKGADVLRASYAIVTTPPHLLSIEQRLPHVDSLTPGRMAIVHYLSPDNADGTAFYRHRATGFETLDEARSGAYFSSLNAELSAQGAPAAAYMNGDTAQFERIGHVGARFNRAVIYRGRILHGGAISNGGALSKDPLKGRLTIASFLAAT
ncbi:MAG: hypothetical protein A3E78_15080 [Alphaproteobacteria bacterium RIFCSPHIGHO2_12_FULL_63_12]|nr:MAG: hypothetical protein A3E78_15080 [Alphaproteobacteria bacterium RIFCSPHIGHO2_12_FULL_63_12]